MGYIRSTITTNDEGKYLATIYWSWYYFWEDSKTQVFDDIQDAKDWILNERTYDRLEITEEARGKMSYADALRLTQNKQNKNKNNKKKNKRKNRPQKC